MASPMPHAPPVTMTTRSSRPEYRDERDVAGVCACMSGTTLKGPADNVNTEPSSARDGDMCSSPIDIENQISAIDSIFALDASSRNANNARMKQEANNLQMLVLERRDSGRNLARFYVLAVEPTLLGDSALVREWGRIGTWGRRRVDLHPDTASAGEALETWLARKTRRGYQIRASSGVCIALTERIGPSVAKGATASAE
jgi:predicted DNA-binding WGR domain protein